MKYLLYLLGIPVLFLWEKLVDSQSQLSSEKKIVKLPMDLPNGTSIRDDILIHKGEKSLIIFSARCSHLGCRINKFDSKGFICPCHGSHFGFNGKVLEGPAYKPLTSLSYKNDNKTNSIIVEIDDKIQTII